ncbi:MAG TPA: lipoyl(octanoyl) transferase LipB [Terriglobales bacterium]|nr:lipoyl(octanoyl) transferase LipB [Terriglobales bacterium]
MAVAALGTVEYAAAERLQQQLVTARQAGAIGDLLLLLEHPPVVTLGRNARREHLRLPAPELARRGIGVAACNRGGDVTFHGPGQLVGYPILDLRQTAQPPCLHGGRPGGGHLGPVDYMRALEEVLIRVAAAFGIPAWRVAGRTGVWCGAPERKLAALGVHISRGVTSHGFALNVATDLALFEQIIVPCGIADRGITSLERELGQPPAMESVAGAVIREFGSVFARSMQPVEPPAVLPAAWEEDSVHA